MEHKDFNEALFRQSASALGLYFNGCNISVAYGIDNKAMKYRGFSVSQNRVISELKDPTNPTEEDVMQAFEKAVRPATVIREYRADYENARDYLYYGYGYKMWRTTNKDYMSEDDAKIVWKAAFNHMANAD